MIRGGQLELTVTCGGEKVLAQAQALCGDLSRALTAVRMAVWGTRDLPVHWSPVG
jgi:hypothetical protein